MTRINCIPPEFLLDQHLLAEYVETAMALASLRRSKATGKPLPKRDHYTLNAGHVIFFYDKGKFLKRRYESLKVELLSRNFSLDESRHMEWDAYSPELMYDWEPTERDQLINVERILVRVNKKPDWYRYKREPIDMPTWQGIYSGWTFKKV